MQLRVALGVPESFIPKAQYALRVLFAPYDVQITWSDITDIGQHGGLYYGVLPYPEQLGDKPVLCIESHPTTWEYFDSMARYNPSNAVILKYEDFDSVPILFGSDTIDMAHPLLTIVQFDLIASAFFWLSDWQDVTRTERDSHDRQPFQGSMQQFLQLHSRAVVDDYGNLIVALLGNILKIHRRDTGWATVMSHDIDRIRKRTAGIAVRETLDYLLLNRRHVGLKARFSRWSKSMRQLYGGSDAYEESIMQIMSEHEQRNVPSCFLFKSILSRHLHDANDYMGYPFFDVMLGNIRKNGIEIGYHSGYEAGHNSEQMRAEYGKLCNRLGTIVEVHRSHYLRYKAGDTFKQLDQLGIRVDSSVAWADQSGFRAQTCRPYPLFDINLNRSLRVLEVPLAVMDTQLFGYMQLDAEDAINDARDIVDTVARHGGVMVWNFHHHIYDEIDAPDWQLLLEAAYDMGKSSQFATFNTVYEKFKHIHD